MQDRTVSRRNVLNGLVSVGAATSLAGCSGSGGSGEPNNTDSDPQGSTVGTTPTESTEVSPETATDAQSGDSSWSYEEKIRTVPEYVGKPGEVGKKIKGDEDIANLRYSLFETPSQRGIVESIENQFSVHIHEGRDVGSTVWAEFYPVGAGELKKNIPYDDGRLFSKNGLDLLFETEGIDEGRSVLYAAEGAAQTDDETYLRDLVRELSSGTLKDSSEKSVHLMNDFLLNDFDEVAEVLGGRPESRNWIAGDCIVLTDETYSRVQSRDHTLTAAVENGEIQDARYV